VNTRPTPRRISTHVGTDAATVLAALAVDALTLLSPSRTGPWRRYAPSKWTLKEVLGHIIDDERIFAHRAFCLARGETMALAGFDEKVYSANADAESRSWEDLLDEYQVVRAASVALFHSMPPAAWGRVGEVNGYRATPRGLAFHIAGHERHHLRLVRERYLPLLALPG
jgi:hypothetical protein